MMTDYRCECDKYNKKTLGDDDYDYDLTNRIKPGLSDTNHENGLDLLLIG